MSVKLLTEHCLEFVSLKDSSKCHIVGNHMSIYEPMRTIRSKKRKNSDKYHKSSFYACSALFHARVHLKLFFFHANP